jgi:hypothetical protein
MVTVSEGAVVAVLAVAFKQLLIFIPTVNEVFAERCLEIALSVLA